MQEILNHSLVQLADSIQKGTYSSLEVIETFITQIKEVNPGLNAVIVPRFEEAIEEAKMADELLKQGKIKGKLHGVPITVKECLDLKGTPSTFGLIRRKVDFPKENDPYIQALMDEGAIVIGKTNVSQLIAYLEADNPLYGRTYNPLHPDFTCGGSSGGEGAIIKAGGSILGLGTDLGGSVRIPAAFCGILGLKPTMQRNFDFCRIIDNVVWESICSVTGVLGKHVEDLALAAKIMGSIPNPFNEKPKSFPDYKKIDVTKLRVGYYLTDGLFEPAASIQIGIKETIEKLEKKGIHCKKIKAYRPRKAEELHTKINSLDGAKLFIENIKNDKPSEQLKFLIPAMKMPPFLLGLIGKIAYLLGQKTAARMATHFSTKSGRNLEKLKQEHQDYIQGFQEMMMKENIDILISPVNGLPAYLHGTSMLIGSAGTYTLMHNVTGFPAGVVPVGIVEKENIFPRKKTLEIANNIARKTELKSEGLAVAIQVAALPWREDLVLAMMGFLNE